MTVRITAYDDGDTTVFRVDGWLRGESVEELLRAVEKTDFNVALDLSELMTCDDQGIQALRYLSGLGAELRCVPTTIDILLDRQGSDTQGTDDDQLRRRSSE